MNKQVMNMIKIKVKYVGACERRKRINNQWNYIRNKVTNKAENALIQIVYKE